MDQKRKPAFTLVELLVVIAVIAVLAAILFPVFARTREKARQTTCLSNLKQIGAGVLMYTQDYDETFPFVLNWSANSLAASANIGDNGMRPRVPGVTGQEPEFQLVHVVAAYVRNDKVWYCPSVGPDFVWQAEVDAGFYKKGARMRDQGTSYARNYLVIPRADLPKSNWSSRARFMGDHTLTLLQEPSRWPMLLDEPGGQGFTGNIGDPPASVAPHSGGMNIDYGDDHAKYHHLEAADGLNWLGAHQGDGIFSDQ